MHSLLSKGNILPLSAISVAIFIFGYLVASYFMKTVHLPKTTTYFYYSKHEESSISAKWWFGNYNKGFEANKDYVIETCNLIHDSYQAYEEDFYSETCAKLGIPVE